MTSLIIVLYEQVMAYRIESNRKIYQLIESIKFHINDNENPPSGHPNSFVSDLLKCQFKA